MEQSEPLVHKNTLPKAQRLHSKKDMAALFASKSTFFQYPFKVVFLFSEGQSVEPLRFMVSASKRNFKSAVDRNRIKRQVRDAWRKQKSPLRQQLLESKQHLDVALLFTEKTILPSAEINNKIKRIIERLMHDHDVYKKTSG